MSRVPERIPLDPAPSVTSIIPALLFGSVIAIPLWL